MGDKLAAKRTMVDAEVPTLPSAEVSDSVDVGAIAVRNWLSIISESQVLEGAAKECA